MYDEWHMNSVSFSVTNISCFFIYVFINPALFPLCDIVLDKHISGWMFDFLDNTILFLF